MLAGMFTNTFSNLFANTLVNSSIKRVASLFTNMFVNGHEMPNSDIFANNLRSFEFDLFSKRLTFIRTFFESRFE